MKKIAIAAAALCAAASVAQAEDTKWPGTFDAAIANVAATGCNRADYPEYTLFNCEKEPAIYYFTKPNTPAYPGVIKRIIENGQNGAQMVTDAHSWGSDDAQPAFVAWMNRVAASLRPAQ